MRILAITHQYPTAAEPVFAPYNRQQFAALGATHDLRLVRAVPWTRALDAWRAGHQLRDGRDAQGIDVVHALFLYPPGLLREAYGRFFEWSVSGAVRRLRAQFDPEVLLSAWAHPDGWAVGRIARRLGVPVVVKVIGSDVRVLASGARRLRVAEALRAADRVVAVSRELAGQVEALGVPRASIAVVPEGLDAAMFSPGDRASARARLGIPPDERMLLFVGNVRASKGALDLVRACARLRDRGVEFHCRLVGETHERAAVMELRGALGIAAHVTLVGVRPQEELPDWYRAADLVTLPSHSEGIPNVLREALACGRPFVATDVGGIPEVADASYSRLVAPRDPEALADALDVMLRATPTVDPAVASRVNVTMDESARRLADVLSAAAADHQRRQRAVRS